MNRSRRPAVMSLALCFAMLAFSLPSCSAVSSAGAAERYAFGVVPQFEQRKLHGIWTPIIRELEKRTGLNFDAGDHAHYQRL